MGEEGAEWLSLLASCDSSGRFNESGGMLGVPAVAVVETGWLHCLRAGTGGYLGPLGSDPGRREVVWLAVEVVP